MCEIGNQSISQLFQDIWSNFGHRQYEPCLSLFLVTVIQGEFVDPPPRDPILSLAEEETVLPCLYKPAADVQVVQVTWYKEMPDATKEQIITAHHLNGQTGQLLVSPSI